MADINETAHFANPSSPGKGVKFIAWINLGSRILITPDSNLTLTNTIPNSEYSIDMTIKGVKGSQNLVSNSLPVPYGVLGTVEYTGVGGYPAFYPQNYSSTTTNVWELNIDDIIVKKSGQPVYNYSFVVADAEQTNLFPYGAESITYTGNGGVWSLYEYVYPPESVSGELELKGLSSDTVLEIATKEGYNPSPILLSQSPTTCHIKMVSPHQREAVALGLMIQEEGIEINKSPSVQSIINETGESFTFNLSFTPPSDTTGVVSYKISDTLINGTSPDLTLTQVIETISGISKKVDADIDIVNNTITFTIPVDNVTSCSLVNIRLVAKIVDPSKIPNTFSNRANISIVSNEPNKNKVNVSNIVKVNTNQTIPLRKTSSNTTIAGVKGNSITFTIEATNINRNIPNSIYIKDQLNELLYLASNLSNVYVNINGKLSKILANISVDNNNLVTVKINPNNIPNNFTITDFLIVKLTATLKNDVNNCTIINNQATLNIATDPTTYTSNYIEVGIISRFNSTLNNLIESIALEETALSHILNAEGEKIQRALELSTNQKQLEEVNNSVQNVIRKITLLESILLDKFVSVNKNDNCTII